MKPMNEHRIHSLPLPPLFRGQHPPPRQGVPLPDFENVKDLTNQFPKTTYGSWFSPQNRMYVVIAMFALSICQIQDEAHPAAVETVLGVGEVVEVVCECYVREITAFVRYFIMMSALTRLQDEADSALTNVVAIEGGVGEIRHESYFPIAR